MLKQYVVPFILGALLMALYASYVSNIGLPPFISGGRITVPALEELFKLISALILIYFVGTKPSNVFVSSLGFGFYEQLDRISYSIGTFSFVTIIMHTVSGLAMSYFLSKKVGSRISLYKNVGYAFLFGVFIHSAYNLIPDITLRILWIVFFGFFFAV